MKRTIRIILCLVLVFGLAACKGKEESVSESYEVVEEAEVLEINLTGPIASTQAEVSAMAWCGDWLILVPQYPAMYDGNVFWISSAELTAYLESDEPEAIEPATIPFDDGGLSEQVSGFEGFEAIAFDGDVFYVTSETRAGDGMLSFLVMGVVEGDCESLTLTPAVQTTVEAQADLSNMSDETILIYQDQVYTIYEANGVNVNPDPVAHVFDLGLESAGELTLPNVEYRITDATTVDDDGIFWAINYFYPGDTMLKPGEDQIAAEFGIGTTHRSAEQVERLVAFQVGEDAITLAGIPPVYLTLDEETSNWEGIVRFMDGFLLVTDEYPTTRLVYVADSSAE